MAILANIKKVITDIVFPELIKNGEYSSFRENTTGRFDYWAQALKELKGGKQICPWHGDATERTRLVICDKEYPEGLLEFDLKLLIDEVPYAPNRQRLHNILHHANNHGRFGCYCYAVEPRASSACPSGIR